MGDRKTLEKEFHNEREKDRVSLSNEEFLDKYRNKRFYAIVKKSQAYMDSWLRKEVKGRNVLDYCCGTGASSLELAKMGANVWGIDISEESIQSAKKAVENQTFNGSVTFETMDAEKMAFEDGKFDVIICKGVLHHLDLKYAYPELARVLKSSGKIIAQEALGYNPLINAYRRLTPHLRTAWEADHILRLKDVKYAKEFFDVLGVRFFHLFDIAAIPLQGSFLFDRIVTLLGGIDSVVLRIPLLQLMAWQMIFVLGNPKKTEK